VALAGKYTDLNDAYISVVESLKHAGLKHECKIEIKWLASEKCHTMEDAKEMLADVDALVVPGGFGVRGIEGKLNVIRYARENNLPFLGLCLGMQCAVIEYARNVLGLENANSTEFAEGTKYPVIDLMIEQKGVAGYGGYPLRETVTAVVFGDIQKSLYERLLQKIAGIVAVTGHTREHSHEHLAVTAEELLESVTVAGKSTVDQRRFVLRMVYIHRFLSDNMFLLAVSNNISAGDMKS